MAGGMECDPNVAETNSLAVGDGLCAAGEIIAIAQPHDVERFLGGQHRAVARPGVVGMAMGDDGALDRPDRIDMKAAGLAAQARRRRASGYLADAYRIYRLLRGLLSLAHLRPVTGSFHARPTIPVFQQSGCRPPVRFCARSAIERRPCRRRRSVAAGDRACPPLPPPGLHWAKFANSSAIGMRRSRHFGKRGRPMPTTGTAPACT